MLGHSKYIILYFLFSGFHCLIMLSFKKKILLELNKVCYYKLCYREVTKPTHFQLWWTTLAQQVKFDMQINAQHFSNTWASHYWSLGLSFHIVKVAFTLHEFYNVQFPIFMTTYIVHADIVFIIIVFRNGLVS